jgi:mono/diheme cytochrome c family protein
MARTNRPPGRAAPTIVLMGARRTRHNRHIPGGFMMMFRMGRILLVTVFGVAIASGPALAGQDAAVIKKGESVYGAQKCQLCHAIGGKGNKQNPLDGVGKKLSVDEIRQWITSPTEMAAKIKSTKKPPMTAKYGGLSAAELDALVAYLASLK